MPKTNIASELGKNRKKIIKRLDFWQKQQLSKQKYTGLLGDNTIEMIFQMAKRGKMIRSYLFLLSCQLLGSQNNIKKF